MKRKSKYDETFYISQIWDPCTQTHKSLTMSLRDIINNPEGLDMSTIRDAVASVLNDMMEFMDNHREALEDLKLSVPQIKNPEPKGSGLQS
jgi:hypothetical protein